MTILVTGGAGYIGSHVTRQLSERGHKAVVYDNLSVGSAEALLHGEKLVIADLADETQLDAVLGQHRFNVVMHFAASTVAPESVTDPLRYYENNTCNTLRLLRACRRHGIDRIVFSSTAAVYGMTDSGAASEETSLAPVNPYGASKMMCERMLGDAARAHGLRYVALRYFNVAGADPQARMGPRTPIATQLIQACCQAALGRRQLIEIFGTDYDTPDGTGVRDYIHVEDIASAHLAAARYLDQGGQPVTLNVGYGRGSSVREIIGTVQRVTGRRFNAVESARRPGDPAMMIAVADRIRSVLDWAPRHQDLERIVADSWRWEQKLVQADVSHKHG